ncbi:MAG: 16S rRNA (cytidine(1402)-2'-O)-methyltransferase [Bacilli bacterium]|nr:16S rRNA (cytidine(1402)-2'-O)-methyltransferase [Bacilli bacterium]
MLQRQKSNNNQPKLYLVGTPIGNFDDMTFRAILTLKEVDLIYCEDTRITSKLLSHFDIHTPLKAYNVMTENDLTEGLINQIKNGKNVAVVTDAGLPGISDPGYLAARYAIDENIDVVMIPGVSASLTALCISGLPTKNFYFHGFLNSKESQRIKELESLKDKEETLIIYEAPHRIKETLSNILEILGNRNITLSRELTKKYEEVLRGTAKEILEVVDELKGEMVLVIQGKQEDELTQNLNNLSIKEHYNFYIEQGVNFKEALKIVAKDRKVSKSIIYQEIFGKNK